MKIIVKYEDRGVEIMHEGLGLKKKQFLIEKIEESGVLSREAWQANV